MLLLLGGTEVMSCYRIWEENFEEGNKGRRKY
jgi:hypothetical protein